MDSYLIFILASFLLAISPGPDNVFVLLQSALFGARAGLSITLGLCTGLLFHISLVAFGLTVVLQTSWAMPAIKLFGAVYLFYLAFKSYTATRTQLKSPAPLSNMALYKRGIIMNSTNPKVSLFFLAFLPQFISSEQGAYLTQTFFLGGLFALTAGCVFTGVAFAGGTLKKKLESSAKLQQTLNQITALVFALLAINLLI